MIYISSRYNGMILSICHIAAWTCPLVFYIYIDLGIVINLQQNTQLQRGLDRGNQSITALAYMVSYLGNQREHLPSFLIHCTITYGCGPLSGGTWVPGLDPGSTGSQVGTWPAVQRPEMSLGRGREHIIPRKEKLRESGN